MRTKTHSKWSAVKRMGSVALALILALTLCFSLTAVGSAFADSAEPEPSDISLPIDDEGAGDDEADDLEAQDPDAPDQEADSESEDTDDPSPDESIALLDTPPDSAAAAEASENIQPLAAILSSDLSDFIFSVTIYDINGLPVTPSTPTFIGQSYEFVINFRENSQLQMQYNTSGVLTYQLPADLNIQNAVPQTPIYGSPPNHAIIGWYTISVAGLVNMWFGNVDLNGNPTPGNINFIDYYANVNVTVSIYAQLVGAADGSIDFGNGVIAQVDPPQPPPPSLSMHKLSQYNPATQQINYMITITALGGPVTNLTLQDTPQINSGVMLNPALTNNAFSGMLYDINGDTANLIPMPVTWTTPPTAAQFTYNTFTDAAGAPLVLQPGDFITIRYSLHLPTLIDNNNGAGQPLVDTSDMFYDFSVNNAVTVGGDGVSNVTDTTNDHVRRELNLVKTGVFDSPSNTILWSITVGDGASIELNGGTITDFLGSGLTLPADNAITVLFYDNLGNVIFTGTAADFDSTAPAPLTGYFESFTYSFLFELPPATDIGAIYEVIMTYSTDVPAPAPGMPTQIYDNEVTYTFDGGPGFSTTSQVPVSAGHVDIEKTTSGICGKPGVVVGDHGECYWVNYTTVVHVPAGLMGKPLYLYDTLGLFPNGPLTFVPNVPEDLSIIAIDDTTGTTAVPAVVFSAPEPFYTNSWCIFFGTTAVPATPSDPNDAAWQYNQAITLTLSYTIYLSDAYVTAMQSNPTTGFLSNAVYLINSTGEPDISATGNSVGGVNVNDYWPLIKSSQDTSNPALFNYTVNINGNFSPRVFPLMQPGSTPLYTDTFDAGLAYVPGSFYVVDTLAASPTYYMPAGDVILGTNSFSISLSSPAWQMYAGTYPNGIPMGAAPQAPVNWFAQKHNFVAHYQMQVANPNVIIAPTSYNNVARLAVDTTNTDACIFESATDVVTYSPERLVKTMTPVAPGSERVDAQIIINADGGYIFSDGISAGPPLITAVDLLENLMIFTDTIQFYTQTLVNGVWNGTWTPGPAPSFNTNTAWSVTVVAPSSVPAGYSGQVNFIVPNQTPVMITYQVLVTLPYGDTGSISNEIGIFGMSDSDGNPSYAVGGQDVGVGASRQALRVFKTDNVGNVLHDASFSLYATDMSAGFATPGGLASALTILGSDGTTVMNFALLPDEVSGSGALLTDVNGMAVFDNEWIDPSFNFLYLLVENQPPPGYIATQEESFMTMNPLLTSGDIGALETLLGAYVNQTSDFIFVTNTPVHALSESLRVLKTINGMSVAEQQLYLQNLEIVITDPNLVEHVYKIADIQDPFGIQLLNIDPGVYLITERFIAADGYTVTTSPRLPIRRYIMPNDVGEVLITITNTYVEIPPVPGGTGGVARTADEHRVLIVFALLLGGIVLTVPGVVLYRKQKTQKISQATQR